MILTDAGPLVALFDPADGAHGRCRQVLATIREPMATTLPVLTEAFHFLRPGSTGFYRLLDFAVNRMRVLFLDGGTLARSFELMVDYVDVPMDLADATLVAAAETYNLTTVFTLDRDFSIYRIRRGHQHHAFNVIG